MWRVEVEVVWFLSYQDQESGPEGSSLRLGSAVAVAVPVPPVQCSVSKQRAQRSGQMRLRMLRGSMTVP